MGSRKEAVTHERASVRDIAKIQWAIGRLHFRDDVVEERMTDAILSHKGQFEPQGLSNIIWSFGFAQPSQPPLLEALLEAFSKKTFESDPQALSNVVWSLAKLLCCRTPFLQLVSLAALKKCQAFDPQGLANIAWSFATLQHSDIPLFSKICDTFMSGSAGWEPQNVVNMLWSCAKVQVSSESFLDAVAAEAMSTMEGWSCQGVANLLWGFAKLASVKAELFDKGEKAVRQKLRRFSPQNSVSVVWAFAKASLLTWDLLDLVASDVVLKAELSPQHFSSLMWACGASSLYHARLLTELSSKATASDPALDFNCQDLSNLAWSCAKLLWTDSPLLGVLAAGVEQQAHVFPSQNLAITVWSFGCLTYLHAPMMAVIMGQVPSAVAHLGPQGLANLAQGCAKQVFKHDALEMLAAEAAACLSSFSNQEFSMFLWSMGKLALGIDLIERAAMETKARCQLLNPQDISVLAWAFAHFTGGRDVLDLLSWEIMKNIADFSPQDLSNISWAFAAASLENAVMMSAVSKQALQKMDKFHAQDLSNMSWAFAKLGLTDETLFDAVAKAVHERVSTLLPQHLSLVSWSFAKLGLLNEAMMEAITREALVKVEDLDGQSVANLLWSCGVLCFNVSWLWRPLVHRALALGRLSGLEISNIAWGLHVLQQMDLLRPFLHRTAEWFLQTDAPGSSWADFANICKDANKAGMEESGLEAVHRGFCESFVGPLLGSLQRLRASGSSGSESWEALDSLEVSQHRLNLRSLGPQYTQEALKALGLSDENGDSSGSERSGFSGLSFLREARRQCRDALLEWQIPSVHSILAYAKWKVVHPSGAECVLAGRVFASQLPQAEEELVALLRPFATCERFAERVALLTLLQAMSESIGQRLEQLADFEGHVKLYLTHVPSLCTLGMLCQLSWPQVRAIETRAVSQELFGFNVHQSSVLVFNFCLHSG